MLFRGKNSVKRLKTELKKSLEAIKTEAKKQRGREENGAAAENFYLAEKEGKAALRDLENCPKLSVGGDSLPQVYTAAREFCFAGEMSEKEVIRAFAGRGFSLDECMLLRLMLKTACICLLPMR